MGLEDLETLVRVFSASNQLAPVVRYATAYRRRVLIHNFLCQWDEEKYQNLGTMLLNNYRQALEIIETELIALTEATKSLGIQDGELDSWQEEQAEYFSTLGDEPERDIHAVAYVELLQELQDVE